MDRWRASKTPNGISPSSKYRRSSSAALLLALATSSESARAAGGGPEINPYECLGRYEAATGNRTMSEVRGELVKRSEPPFDPDDAPGARAVKLCVIALLKSRLGDADASRYYDWAIREAPEEPGFEMFAGNYYAGFRGARRPVLELAERHYYRALAALDALRATDRFRDYHAVVEQWVRKRLLVLYQEDGQPLLPWKAYPHHESGLAAPGVSASSQLSVSRDTRDFFANNEMRVLTGEANFAESDLRVGKPLTARQIWNLVRAPLRYRTKNRVRLRHNFVGAVDLIHDYSHAQESQITNFYKPDETFTDFTSQELGVGYERVVPLYPLFDVRLEGSFRRVSRKGAIEFLPDKQESFNLYEAKPSVSRFLGSDKVTVDGVYALLDIADVVGGIPDERLRKEYIRAVKVQYALYSPLVLPTFEGGDLHAYRTPTRGLYFYGGFAQDDQLYGVRTVTRRDYYAGARFEGPGAYDLTLQGTLYTSRTTYADPNELHPVVRVDPAQSASSYRTTLVLQRRIIDPDAMPGVPAPSLGFVPDMLNLVFPITHDLAVSGRRDYENFRAGTEVWLKLFGTGIGGTAVLMTLGYDYQYFYRIVKSVHMAHAHLRVGWGDL
jgi:hypothetical protein